MQGFLDWSDWELRAMVSKTQKRLMMFGTFHKKWSLVWFLHEEQGWQEGIDHCV